MSQTGLVDLFKFTHHITGFAMPVNLGLSDFVGTKSLECIGVSKSAGFRMPEGAK